jgi:hypothetical protein
MPPAMPRAVGSLSRPTGSWPVPGIIRPWRDSVGPRIMVIIKPGHIEKLPSFSPRASGKEHPKTASRVSAVNFAGSRRVRYLAT